MWGQQKQSDGTRRNQPSPGTPTTGLRERGNDTGRSTGRSGRQNAATRRNMRREDRLSRAQGNATRRNVTQEGGGGGVVMHPGGSYASSATLLPDRKAPMVPLMRLLLC